jgi:Leucine-rich repeat (LRR) protein
LISSFFLLFLKNFFFFLQLNRFNKISHIAPGAFHDLPSLNQINLASNLLATLTPGLFSDLPQLSVLDLTNNVLTNVDGAFEGLGSLTKLVLTRNRLQTLTAAALRPLTKVSEGWFCIFVKVAPFFLFVS